MTHNSTKMKLPSRKASLFAGGAFVLVAVMSTLFLNGAHTDNGFLVYGNNETQGLTATLQTAQGTQNLQQTNGHFTLPEALRENFSAPYRLSFSVPAKNGARQEYVLNLSQDGKQLGVSLDGFEADDTVSLAIGGDTAFKDVPMDWSGRNELTAAIDGDKSVKACIEINGVSPALLCHVIAQGSKA